MLGRIKQKIINILNIKGNIIFEKAKNKNTINALNKIYHETKNCRSKYKSLLLDGGFYNLGYFYRLQLIRSALKSSQTKEHAFIWDCNIKLCRKLLNSIGIKNISSLKGDFDKEIFSKAENYLTKITSKKDLLNIKLPFNIPGSFLYDSVLKLQKTASVNINDVNLKTYIYKFLYSIKFTENLLDLSKPDLIVLSHCNSYQCTPIAWIASKKRIPIIVLGGDFGILRLWKISNSNDIYWTGRPNRNDLKNIPLKKKMALESIGKEYISNRVSGLSSDISGKYAFQGKRKKLTELGIHQVNKKIIAIYAACFGDFPHLYGMKRFTDMLDWLKFTIEKASENKKVLWLLKPHPMEKWFGGKKVADIFEGKLPENIILLPNSYSGKDIIKISDALVTLHGTSGIEFAAMGKPVLIGDQGWYHDCSFVLFPKSREDYGYLLTQNWYENINLIKTRFNAQLFTGIFFGIPKWQKDLILPDDSDRELLRKKIPFFVKHFEDSITKEIVLIKNWINSDNKDYHGFKIMSNSKFTTLINK